MAHQPDPGGGMEVQWQDFVRFLRQLSHDLRNHLNAMELQSALLNELLSDPELKDEVKRLRGMIAETSNALQKLVNAANPPTPNTMEYKASDLFEDIQNRVAATFPEQKDQIEWSAGGETGEVEIDPQLLPEAFLEIFRNAFQHGREEGPITVAAGVEGGTFSIVISEPKSGFDRETASWGRQPLHDVSRGHYGLGLTRARAILKSHHGDLRAHHDPAQSRLVTTASLPLRRG